MNFFKSLPDARINIWHLFACCCVLAFIYSLVECQLSPKLKEVKITCKIGNESIPGTVHIGQVGDQLKICDDQSKFCGNYGEILNKHDGVVITTLGLYEYPENGELVEPGGEYSHCYIEKRTFE